MKNLKPIIPIILILVGLGVGFGGGYWYRNYRLAQTRGNFANGASASQRFAGTRGSLQNGMMRGGATQGTILSMDDKSITVKLTDGSSKIVLFSSLTTYSNTATATKSDLKTGGEVSVFGTPNSDGSVTATSIQINPMFFRPQTSPSPTP